MSVLLPLVQICNFLLEVIYLYVCVQEELFAIIYSTVFKFSRQLSFYILKLCIVFLRNKKETI